MKPLRIIHSKPVEFHRNVVRNFPPVFKIPNQGTTPSLEPVDIYNYCIDFTDNSENDWKG